MGRCSPGQSQRGSLNQKFNRKRQPFYSYRTLCSQPAGPGSACHMLAGVAAIQRGTAWRRGEDFRSRAGDVTTWCECPVCSVLPRPARPRRPQLSTKRLVGLLVRLPQAWLVPGLCARAGPAAQGVLGGARSKQSNLLFELPPSEGRIIARPYPAPAPLAVTALRNFQGTKLAPRFAAVSGSLHPPRHLARMS